MMHYLYGVLRSLLIYRLRPGIIRRLSVHYREFVGDGDLVFDLGAHVGNRTKAFAALGAHVVAVEPQPRLTALLRRTFRNDPHVTVDPRAVGHQNGEITLHICPTNPTIASTSGDWVARTRELPEWNRFSFTDEVVVEQVSLDTLITTYGVPRFVKIDVEGREADVLAGLSQPLSSLSLEFLPADRDVAYHSVLRLERLAAEHGVRYEYNFSLGEELRFVMPSRWWNATELDAYLDEIPKDGPSGDIYARLQSSGRDT